MKKILVFLFSIFFSLEVQSGKSDPWDNYFPDFEIKFGHRTICKTKSLIGYYWKENEYVQTKFKNQTIIFEKLDHKNGVKIKVDKYELDSINNCRNDDNHIGMRGFGNQKDTNNSFFAILNRCYKIFDPESEYTFLEHVGFYCVEYYYQREGEKKTLERISCDNGKYVFHPEKILFVSPSDISKDPKKITSHKDSFTLGHGICEVMNN